MSRQTKWAAWQQLNTVPETETELVTPTSNIHDVVLPIVEDIRLDDLEEDSDVSLDEVEQPKIEKKPIIKKK